MIRNLIRKLFGLGKAPGRKPIHPAIRQAIETAPRSLSHSRLARSLGVSITTVWRYRRGKY